MRKNVILCEWKNLYYIKKACLIILCIFISYYIYANICNIVMDQNTGLISIFLFRICFATVMILFVGKYSLNYVREKYKCIPVISRYFSRKQLKNEIALEKFSPIDDFERSDFYNKLLIGKDWICLNNQFVYIKAVSMIGIVEKHLTIRSRIKHGHTLPHGTVR